MEFVTNAHRALNDLEQLTHLYPELRVLNFHFDNYNGATVLIGNPTFDEFQEHLANPCWEFQDTRKAYQYHSTARYYRLTLSAYSETQPENYPETVAPGKED